MHSSAALAVGTQARARRASGALATLVVVAALLPAAGSAEPAITVIVREAVPTSSAAETAVARLGGKVVAPLSIIGGFAAKIGQGMVDVLRRDASTISVTPDARISLSGAKDEPRDKFRKALEQLRETNGQVDNHASSTTSHSASTTGSTPTYESPSDGDGDADDSDDKGTVDGFATVDDSDGLASWAEAIKAMRADKAWKKGHTGQGVDVALIDSGIAPVEGLAGQAIDGPDLSFDSLFDEARYLDGFGHGTHMASLIAGRDSSVRPGEEHKDYTSGFTGIAPGARVLSLKVAISNGAVDVSQVIAAIDWVVQHRNTDGLNVRVLSLSFGTDGVQDYRLDPLAFAVEVAWRRGIVVVAAAGNDGLSRSTLNNPAYDPFVIAAAAVDSTAKGGPNKYTTPDWQTGGNEQRHPDLSAPGRSVVGLRAPGSWADEEYPQARVGNERFFRGSGSSQATALISGAAAVLLSQRPEMSPDQVKAVLMASARPLPKADPLAQGAGLVDLKAASEMPTPPGTNLQPWQPATGTGSLEGARGGFHVSEDGIELVGEFDIFGQPWDGRSWSEASWEGRSWSGGDWNGSTWTGTSWTGSSWTGRSWSGRSWTGTSWTGRSWSGRSWSGRSWSGRSWTGRSWSGSSWSGRSWTGRSWSGRSWSTEGWG